MSVFRKYFLLFLPACIAYVAYIFIVTRVLSYPYNLSEDILPQTDLVNFSLSKLGNRDILIFGTSELTGYQTPRYDSSLKNFTTILNEDQDFPYYIHQIGTTRLFMTDVYYFLKEHAAFLHNKKIIISINSHYFGSDWNNEKNIFLQNIGGNDGTRLFGNNIGFYRKAVFDDPLQTRQEFTMKKIISKTGLSLDKNISPYQEKKDIFTNFENKLGLVFIKRFDPKSIYLKHDIDYKKSISRAATDLSNDDYYRLNKEYNVRQGMEINPGIMAAIKSDEFVENKLITKSIFAISEIAKKKNIDLVFIIQPTNMVFEQKIGKDNAKRTGYFDQLEKVLRKKGTKVINLNKMGTMKGIFADTVHLNTYGAYILALRLRGELNAIFSDNI